MDTKPNDAPQEQSQTEAGPAPQPQVVQQYVVQEKSLKGLGGALITWLIIFSLFAIGYIYTFATALADTGLQSTGEKVVALLFTPFLAAGFIASVVLISLQKKLAVRVTHIVLGLTALYGTINAIVSFSSNGLSSANNVPILIAGILVSYILIGLVALYFIVSKRVKQTLVN